MSDRIFGEPPNYCPQCVANLDNGEHKAWCGIPLGYEKRAPSTNAHGWQDGNELTERIAKLESQLAEARKDSERMDWLVGGDSHGYHKAWSVWDGETDFREAIDAARTSVEEGKP